MEQPRLLFRERQGLAAVVAITLQCVLDRTPGELYVEGVLREIEDVLGEAIANIRASLAPVKTAVAPTLVTAPASPVPTYRDTSSSLTDTKPPKARSMQSRWGTALPVEVLRRIMGHLHLVPGSGARGCFPDLTAAASVCWPWRSVALSSSELWSVIHCPSRGELAALDTILHRASDYALDVDLELWDIPKHIQSAAINSLTEHMHHVQRLTLRGYSGSDGPFQKLMSSQAPILRELHIFSPERVHIRADFLGGRSPKLASLTFPAHGSFPRACASLDNLTTLRLLHCPPQLLIGQVCYLLRLCPRLRELRLDFAFRDALVGAQPAAREFRRLQTLTLSELAPDGKPTPMGPTLQLFDLNSIAHVHLRAATAPTAGALVRELLGGVQHLSFLRAAAEESANALVLRHRDGHQQTFSELPAATLEQLLMKLWPASAQLTTLGVSEHMDTRDAILLSELHLPALRVFSIFVRGDSQVARSSSSLTHIFDLYQETHREWCFPALDELVFDSRLPIRDVFPSTGAHLALSAAGIFQFYADVIQRSVECPPCLVMAGVSFRERFSGPEVNALRVAFSEVVWRAE